MPLCRLILCAILTHVPLCRGETVNFEWATAAFAGRPNAAVALLVPAELDEARCHLQLDTGLNSSVAWHAPDDEARARTVRVKVAGREVTVPASHAVMALIETCRPGQPVGSLGNEFFASGTLTLDLRNRWIDYSEKSLLETTQSSMTFDYRPVVTGGGHVVVDVDVAGTTEKMLFDTGSAALDIGAFGQARWERLTGNAPLRATDAVTTFEVQAWGRPHACFLTAGDAPLRLGSAALSNVSITYCPTIGTGFSADVAGVVGLHPFAEHVVVIDYPARRWTITRAGDGAGVAP